MGRVVGRFGRLTNPKPYALGAALVAVIGLAACQPRAASPEASPSASVSPSAVSQPDQVIGERDGFTAVADVCAEMDWSSLTYVSPTPVDGTKGGYGPAEDSTPGVLWALCLLKWPELPTAPEWKDKPSIDLAMRVMTSPVDAADLCGTDDGEQAEGTPDGWDGRVRTVDPGKGYAYVTMRRGMFCGEVVMRLGSTVWAKLTDPERTLTGIAFGLIEQGWNRSRTENRPR